MVSHPYFIHAFFESCIISTKNQVFFLSHFLFKMARKTIPITLMRAASAVSDSSKALLILRNLGIQGETRLRLPGLLRHQERGKRVLGGPDPPGGYQEARKDCCLTPLIAFGAMWERGRRCTLWPLPNSAPQFPLPLLIHSSRLSVSISSCRMNHV